MIEHIGQTAKIDKLINEIINEEKEQSYFEGAYNLLEDAFNLTIVEAKDYDSLVQMAREIFRVDD